ncbi:hypothetical protein D9M68_869250 [compost metagenome]
MKGPSKQCGAALVVALLMLVVMALLGVSAINSSTVNQSIISNVQSQQEAEAAAQDAIEQTISSISAFKDPVASTRTVNGLSVSVSAPVCTGAQVLPGYSRPPPDSPVQPPKKTQWEISATVDDETTGSKVVIRQGVSIVMRISPCD